MTAATTWRPAAHLTRARRLHAFLAASLAVITYTHVGYPLLVRAIARPRRRRARPPRHAPLPTMTVVIPAFNEEEVIAAKLRDTLTQEYPDGRLDVVVVADGSSDHTAAIAEAMGVRVRWTPERRGKSAAVDRGMASATGEVVVLTDANCILDPGSLVAIARPFVEADVGVASGVKVVSGSGGNGAGEGLYWRLEAQLKEAEGAIGCVMGAPGEICGVRRTAFRPMSGSWINDDYQLTCDVLRRGWRVVYVPQAVAREEVSATVAEEIERRTRIGAGTWQVTLAHLALCDPRRGWIALVFVSHRVLRSIVVPVLLPTVLAASGVGARRDPIARALFAMQATAYGVALAGGRTRQPLAAAPFQFLLTNATTLRGGVRFLTGRQPITWRKASRQPLSLPSGPQEKAERATPAPPGRSRGDAGVDDEAPAAGSGAAVSRSGRRDRSTWLPGRTRG